MSTEPEPTIGELYEHVAEHGPVVIDGWRITAWPTDPSPAGGSESNEGDRQ